jgi:formylmethanofuran dehydrogenase subunit D
MTKEDKTLIVSVGKIHIDSKGAGRIYLKKKVVEVLEKIGIQHGDEVRIEVKDGKIIVTKL